MVLLLLVLQHKEVHHPLPNLKALCTISPHHIMAHTVLHLVEVLGLHRALQEDLARELETLQMAQELMELTEQMALPMVPLMAHQAKVVVDMVEWVEAAAVAGEDI